EVIDFMRADALEKEKLSELNVLVRERTAIYELRHPEIAGIIAVSRNTQFASNTIKQITRDPLTEEGWYQAAVSHSEQFHLFSHPIGRNIKEEPNLSADQVLSVAKAVHDPLTNEILGVILIDMKLDFIQQNVESVSLGKNG